MDHLVRIIIHEQDSMQMLEPFVQRLACVPCIPPSFNMLIRCLSCMPSAAQFKNQLSSSQNSQNAEQQAVKPVSTASKSKMRGHVSIIQQYSQCCIAVLLADAVTMHCVETLVHPY